MFAFEEDGESNANHLSRSPKMRIVAEAEERELCKDPEW